jgi:hypothetical protein
MASVYSKASEKSISFVYDTIVSMIVFLFIVFNFNFQKNTEKHRIFSQIFNHKCNTKFNVVKTPKTLP